MALCGIACIINHICYTMKNARLFLALLGLFWAYIIYFLITIII